MGDSDTEIPLLERAEMPELPTIPKEAQNDLVKLEREFMDAEVELLRKAIPVMRPLYAKRNELISSKLKEADFWPRVFANAPAEIDEYIRPSDAQIIGSCLKNMTIDRFEVNEKGEGEPRSVRFTFDFSTDEENTWFEESKLVKEFHWRKHIVDGPGGKPRVWEGLVSEPVRITWKKEMDPTSGLLDAACDLADAEKAFIQKESKDKITAEERTKLPEYEKLVMKTAQIQEEVENAGEGDDEEGESSPLGTSFFAWFGYRGRDVTAADSARAAKEEPAILEKAAKEEQKQEEVGDDLDLDEEEDDDGLEDAEIFPDGEGFTFALGEDLWPNALKYYTQSYDVDDDIDFDMSDLPSDDDEDDEEEQERPRKKAKT